MVSINKINVKGSFQTILFLSLVFISILSTIVSFGTIKMEGFRLLFLLPISFLYFIVICSRKVSFVPYSIGVTLIIGLEFVKLVIYPLLFVCGGFPLTILYHAESNAVVGILLQVYEVLWISIALVLPVNIKQNSLDKYGIDNYICNKRFKKLILLLLIITLIICLEAPEILQNYRVITSAKDSDFTMMEQSYIVNSYSSSTLKKLFLVLANYILKPVRLILPAFLMVNIYRKFGSSRIVKVVNLFLAISPFLFVDGTIARSLYFSLVLLLLYNSLYKFNINKIIVVFTFVFAFIVVYWIIRFMVTDQDVSLLYYFGEKVNDYFCGFNIVGAVSDLPKGFSFRFKYFIHDFLRAVPFSNTLFGLESNDTVRTFFNLYTHSPNGQIPATLAMGCYYLSPIFAPLYSYLFTRFSVISSYKANNIENPYYGLVWNISALYFALGTSMNDISVTLGNFVQVILPLLIIVCISYPNRKESEIK